MYFSLAPKLSTNKSIALLWTISKLLGYLKEISLSMVISGEYGYILQYHLSMSLIHWQYSFQTCYLYGEFRLGKKEQIFSKNTSNTSVFLQ